jgi:hypothetical protein
MSKITQGARDVLAASFWRSFLRRKYPGDKELVEEYIKEAEHQDGDAYWQNFTRFEDLYADFELYKENTNE